MPKPPRYALAVSAPSKPSDRTSSPSTYAIAGERPSPRGHLAEAGREAGGVEAAGVRHDLHAPLEGETEAVLELADEGPGVPQRRVLQLVAAEDQHRQLGQVVTGEDVQRPALEHLAHRREPVAVEAGAVADPEDVSHEPPAPLPADPRSTGRCPATGRRRGPVATSGGVGAVHALGDQEAEVVRRPGHGLRGVLRPPGPHGPRGRDEGDPELLRRRRLAADGEAEVARAHAEVGDVPHPVGDRRLDAECLVDVEPVRPGLHEPRGGHRRRRHGRPVPRHLLAVGVRPQRRGQRLPAAAPAGEQRRRAAPRRPPARPCRRRGRGPPAPPARRASHACLSVAAASAASSVQARWATWVATSQPAAGVGVRQPASSSPETRASRAAPSAARSASTPSSRALTRRWPGRG